MNLGLSTVHMTFCRYFVPVVTAEIEVEFQSGRDVMSQWEPVSIAQYVSSAKNREKKASGEGSNSGDLGLP